MKKLEWLIPYYNDIELSRKQVIDYLNVATKHENQKSLKRIYLYITFECNQQCQYCWIHNNVSDSISTMPISLIDKVISEAVLLGLESVKITGGEPFTNPNLAMIVNLILEKGLNLDIETNGTLINKEWIKSINNKENLFLKISLDAAIADIHDNLARSSVFKKTLESMGLLSEYGIKYGVVTVLNHLNFQYLEDIIKFVSDLGALTHRIILNIQPIGRGKNVEELKLNLSENVEVINRFYKLKAYNDKIELGTLHTTLPPAFIPLDNFNFNSCNWGIGLCGIMPNGDVTLCSPAFDDMNLVAGNIYKGCLTDIWNHSNIFCEELTESKLEGVCSKCLFNEVCRGMCRVFARATYGSENSPYPFCQEMYNEGLFPLWALNIEK